MLIEDYDLEVESSPCRPDSEELAATVSRRSLAETRRQVWLDQHRDVRSAIEAAAPLLDEMMGEDDYARGVEALLEKRLPGFVCHAIPGAVDHGQPVVTGKPGAMPVKKIPIKAVERTGVLPRALSGVVPASAAIVTHLANVIGRGDIRFGRHDAAVGKLAHPACVDNLYPLDGVDINPQIPGIHFIRMHARQQGKIACDHQPLDMMGVGRLEGLGYRDTQAVHVRIPRPIVIRQMDVMIEVIKSFILRHVGPVDAAHVFPPAEYLPYEPFQLFEPDLLVFFFLGRRYGRLNHFHGMQHLGVERKGQP